MENSVTAATVTIYARADILRVRLTLAPIGYSSQLETLILRAISGGANTADELASIFGLAPRLLLDFLADLWSSGRIIVGLSGDDEAIRLSTQGKQDLAVAIAAHEDVRASALRSVERDVILERLTGRVLPRARAERLPPMARGLLVPTAEDDPTPERIRQADLAAALEETIRMEGTPGGGVDAEQADGSEIADVLNGMRVHAAHISPSILNPTPGRLFVPIRVSAYKDGAERLTIEVVEPQLTPSQRSVASARLRLLVERAPLSPFAQALRRNAGSEPLHLATMDDTIDRFRRAVKDVGSAPPSRRQQAHDIAQRHAVDLDNYILNRVKNEMDAEVLSDRDGHLRAIASILKNAERQVVLALPFITSAGLESLSEEIQEAVERGITVILLWGISSKGTLDPQVLSRLEAIGTAARNRGRGGRILFHTSRSSRLHVKLAIQDDRRVVVTSRNFLSNSKNVEAGLLLGAPEPNQASPVIQKILDYIYYRAPDPALAHQMLHTPGAFGPREEAHSEALALPRWRASLGSENADPAEVQAWRLAWQGVTDELVTSVHRRRPVVDVISDELHHELPLLWLTRARRRFLVTSDRAREAALTTEFLQLARRRALSGVAVSVRFGDPDEAVTERLAPFLIDKAVPLDAMTEPRMHAKVIICDIVALVGSFNHLSLNAGNRRQSVGELSVRVESAAIASEVWQHVVGSAPPEVDPIPPEPDSLAFGDSDGVGGAVLQDLVAALRIASSDLAPLIHLVATQPLDGLLRAVDRFDPGLGARTRVIAAAILAAEAAGVPDSLIQELFRSTWAEGLWGASNEIQAHLSSPVARPRSVVTGAMSSSAGLLQAVRADAKLSDHEAMLIGTAAVIGLLLGRLSVDSEDVAVILEGSQHTSDNRLKSLLSALIRHWHEYGALPAGALSQVQLNGEADRVDKLWGDLAKVVFALKRYRSQSPTVEAIIATLYEPRAEMAVLESVVADRNEERLAAWIRDRGSIADERWIDAVCQVAGQPAVYGRRRTNVVGKRRAIRTTARMLQRELNERQGLPHYDEPHRALMDEILKAARELVEHLRGDDPELFAARTLVLELDAVLTGGEPSQHDYLAAADGAEEVFPSLRTLDAHAPDGGEPHQRLVALCEDLAARHSPESSIRCLASRGEFAVADLALMSMAANPQATPAVVNLLREEVEADRRRAQDDIATRATTLQLWADGLGADIAVPGPLLEGTVVNDRVVDTQSQLDGIELAIGSWIASRCDELAEALAARPEIPEDWASYVRTLIKDQDIEAAQVALAQGRGAVALPRPVPLPTWTSTRLPLGDIARWLSSPADDDVPQRVRERFAPLADDVSACRVVEALRALSEDPAGGLVGWASAIQQLIWSEPPTPDGNSMPALEATVAEGRTIVQFTLPAGGGHLPVLRWDNSGVTPVVLGSESDQSHLIRLSPALNDLDQSGGYLDVGDILSIIARPEPDRTPTAHERGQALLRVLCSRLPMAEVISPDEIPAGPGPHERRRLAWLLATLGLTFTGPDLDALRALSGGHRYAMWYLIDHARLDPVRGIRNLREQHDYTELMTQSVRADLHDDHALLVLIAILKLEDEIVSEDDLRAAVDLCAGQAVSMTLGDIRLRQVMERLERKRYLRSGAISATCDCPVIRALRRDDLDAVLEEVRTSIEVTLEAEEARYREILYMLRHSEEAHAKVAAEEQMAIARNLAKQEVNDPSPFDLREFLSDFRKSYMEHDDGSIDVLWPQGTDAVSVPGPRPWLGLALDEVLNNARRQVLAGNSQQIGTIILELDSDPTDLTAVLRVSDSGPGFSEEMIQAFSRGQAVPRVSQGERISEGTGLAGYRRYAAQRGVTMEIHNDERNNPESPIAGGARVEFVFSLSKGDSPAS